MQAVEKKYAKELKAHNVKLAEVIGEEFKDGITPEHYINQEYLKIKEEGGTQYKILEKLKKFQSNAEFLMSLNT